MSSTRTLATAAAVDQRLKQLLDVSQHYDPASSAATSKRLELISQAQELIWELTDPADMAYVHLAQVRSQWSRSFTLTA
jgi:hypothetical protein